MFSKKFASFEMRGFDEYLSVIQNMGKDINEVVAIALEASAEPIAKDVKAWAEEHRFTGATVRGLIKPKAAIDGNDIKVEVGINGDGESWHAVFAEYGSPHNKGDHGIRDAFENNKKMIKQIQVQVLKREGMPVGE